jgi:hypothetical protein
VSRYSRGRRCRMYAAVANARNASMTTVTFILSFRPRPLARRGTAGAASSHHGCRGRTSSRHERRTTDPRSACVDGLSPGFPKSSEPRKRTRVSGARGKKWAGRFSIATAFAADDGQRARGSRIGRVGYPNRRLAFIVKRRPAASLISRAAKLLPPGRPGAGRWPWSCAARSPNHTSDHPFAADGP